MKSKTFKKQLQKPYSTPKSYSEQSIIEQKKYLPNYTKTANMALFSVS